MINIRTLRREDAGELALLDSAVFSQPWSEQEFVKLTERSYCHYMVAEKEGRVIGCAGYICLGDEADIDKVVVDERYRGQGIADSLMEALFAEGERLGVTAYTLEVRVGNRPAISLYEKHGFVSEGIRPGFYDKPKEDANIMWKRL